MRLMLEGVEQREIDVDGSLAGVRFDEVVLTHRDLWWLCVRLKSRDVRQRANAMASLERLWKKINPTRQVRSGSASGAPA